MPPATHAKGGVVAREERGAAATNLGSLAAVVAAAAAAACLAPRGATAQFLSVPDTFLSSTDPSAPCPVDVDNLRLDPGLGEACDPGVQGDNLCDACVCDMALRLAEAGYRITGPDAVPFQACALQNLLALQQRGGLSIGGMMEVSRRCKSAPACIREISDDFFAPAETPGGGAAAPTASILLDDDDDDSYDATTPKPALQSTWTARGRGASSRASSPLLLASPTLRPEVTPRTSRLRRRTCSPRPSPSPSSSAVSSSGSSRSASVASGVARDSRRRSGRCRSGRRRYRGVASAGGWRRRRLGVSAGIGEVRFDDVVVVAGAGGRGKTPFSTASRRRLRNVPPRGAPRSARPQRRRQEHPPQRRRRPSGPRPRDAPDGRRRRSGRRSDAVQAPVPAGRLRTPARHPPATVPHRVRDGDVLRGTSAPVVHVYER